MRGAGIGRGLLMIVSLRKMNETGADFVKHILRGDWLQRLFKAFRARVSRRR
jgi:hypothetical protein